jgi:two-component system sensor histidine kinase QseC
VAKLLAVVTAHEVEEQDFDDYADDLVAVAKRMAAVSALESDELGYKSTRAGLNGAGHGDRLIFQIWNRDGQLLVKAPGAPSQPLSARPSNGFSDETINSLTWRVYTLNLFNENFRIHVARSLSIIEAQVNEFVVDVLRPLLLALPLFGILWLVVHRGLEPLHHVSRLIAERDYRHLNPVLVDGIPEESSRLVDEINALLSRLRSSIERNSRFTADVAHELRTPIAGMLVQLQSDDAELDATQRAQIITKVRSGLEHLGHVVNQLLVLASIEPERIRRSFEAADLAAITGDMMSELSPLALEKNIEIELDACEPAYVLGNQELLGVMISNLVNNAIKFTPEGGHILVEITNATNGISLSVKDNGTGIPEDKKVWVFERLNRLSEGGGRGLGLSIVKEICQLHQATVSLHDRSDGTGLIVNLFLPSLSKD